MTLCSSVEEWKLKALELQKKVEKCHWAEDALRKNEKRLEAQLVQAAKMEALGTLVAGVAHEINNPINLIMYNTPLLDKIWSDLDPILKRHADREPLQRYGGLTYDFLSTNLPRLLEDMDMAANRIAKIVGDLKRFAKQSYVTDKTFIQVNTAVENAIRLAHTTLRQANVRIHLNLDPDLPEMKGNLQNIEQIILNIVINAIQSIEHSHGEITIHTAYRPRDGLIRISIADNGRGVDPSLADRLFDPFVTSKQTNGGTGLGLSVSYSLVKAHDGTITFNSQPGQGTTFTVAFPTSMEERKIKILVVDDEKWMRHLLKEALSKNRPYLLDESANGVEALIRLGASRPNLLILDLFMPKMDGLEVCRAIKADPNLGDMKVIITTGFPNHPKLAEVARLGFNNIHYKPFNLRKFMQTVDRILKI